MDTGKHSTFPLEYNLKLKQEDKKWIESGPAWCRSSRAWTMRQLHRNKDGNEIKFGAEYLEDSIENASRFEKRLKEHIETSQPPEEHIETSQPPDIHQTLETLANEEFTADDQPNVWEENRGQTEVSYHEESESARRNRKGRTNDNREEFLEKLKGLEPEEQVRLREERVERMTEKTVQPHFWATKQYIKEASKFRDEYASSIKQSWQHHPGNQYIQERLIKDQLRAKQGLPVPKPVQVPLEKRPKPLGPALTESEEHAEESTESTKLAPVMTETLCSVCNVEFCGPVPAKQHYAGQKHAKKWKQHEQGELPQAVVIKTTPRRVEAQVVAKVGMKLDYCELCEKKLSDNPLLAAGHYSSPSHLKFLKLGADTPGLPGKSSLQRVALPRAYTGTWADNVQVSDVPQWGRDRFNRMGHRIKLKGVGSGPGKQPFPGEEESECRFCTAQFCEGAAAINHYMGKRHQTRLIQTACQAPRKMLAPPPRVGGGKSSQSICFNFSM